MSLVGLLDHKHLISILLLFCHLTSLPTNCMTQRLQHVTFVMQKRALLSTYHQLFVYLSLYPCCILSFNLCGGGRRLSIYLPVCLSLATTRHYNTTQYFLYSSSSVGNTHSSLQGHHLHYQWQEIIINSYLLSLIFATSTRPKKARHCYTLHSSIFSRLVDKKVQTVSKLRLDGWSIKLCWNCQYPKEFTWYKGTLWVREDGG